MGRFILCTTKRAAKPFVFPVSETDVYTIEELCYYIYHNIYEITEECFDNKLANWFREELNMEVIASKLETMIEIKSSLKDRVISIMCCCDYYTENDIKALLVLISDMEKLPYHGRQKLKADHLLHYGKYALAKKEYDKILNGGYAVNLTSKEYGSILHNRSMACFYIGSYYEAIDGFKEAFARNNNPLSLRHYLIALLLNNEKERYDEEIIKYGITQEEDKAISDDISNAYLKASESKGYMELLKEIKNPDKEEMHRKAGIRLNILKEQFRDGVVY